jgi:hypothetical protein
MVSKASLSKARPRNVWLIIHVKTNVSIDYGYEDEDEEKVEKEDTPF